MVEFKLHLPKIKALLSIYIYIFIYFYKGKQTVVFGRLIQLGTLYAVIRGNICKQLQNDL